MRVLRDHQDGIVQSYSATAQHSSLARAQELWGEWEIQCLVMASFSLQALLLFSADFRKRHNSRVLRGLLWLAYLLADSVAIYLLGRLTLLVGDDPRHQLPLFWAPFLLLHLGGQDTITAFSMEDNALWKRHLLNLITQVAMAIYLVGKEWRGDKLLVAPMVLMFISGTVKYAERIWALRTAVARTPAVRSFARYLGMSEMHWRVDIEKQENNFTLLLEKATADFPLSLDFFMEVLPTSHFVDTGYGQLRTEYLRIQFSENRAGTVDKVYKLAEVQLSLIYDYLYTKFGTVRFRGLGPITRALHWLGTLSLTSAALALFVRAMANDQKGRPVVIYCASDVIISYLLLIGAIMLEISSLFIAFISSRWAGPGIARHLHPQSRREWSGKLGQYNMLRRCVQEEQAAARLLQRAMSWIGVKGDTTHADVSPGVKGLLIDILLKVETAPSPGSLWFEWDSTKFEGHWALGVANAKQDPHRSAAQELLEASGFGTRSFVRNALCWHIVTEICLLLDDNCDTELISSIKMLSDYIMYLINKCHMMVDSDGHFAIDTCRDRMLQSGILDVVSKADFVKFNERRLALRSSPDSYYDRVVPIACDCVNLMERHKLEAGDRWELIALVWAEMLCYMALNGGAAFHAKHLSTGGEFVTHVKMLLYMLRLPFR